jgi:hypothetical protein
VCLFGFVVLGFRSIVFFALSHQPSQPGK